MGRWLSIPVLVVLIACGDDDPEMSSATGAAPVEEPEDPPEEPEEIEDEALPERARLEAACFEGDREACDELGH